MSKTSKRAISIFACILLVLTTLAVSALAASSNFTVTVSADKNSAKPGDIVTVNVKVTGHQFCAAQIDLAYDADSFAYVSTMSGWSDDGDGRLCFLGVNASGGYWEDGKVLGTFKFMVKDNAPAGDAAFCVGKDSSVFIVGDWADGASTEPAKPLEAQQLINTSVTVTSEQGESNPPSDYGAISDDGSTLNMEAGHKVYSIPDADNEKVVWKSSDESIVTVGADGLVTAVSDGSAVLTATDEDGNELEQRTVTVGEVQTEQENEQTQLEQTASQGSDAENTSSGHLWVVLAALAAVVVCVVVIVVKAKRKN